jgi:hypothetical protein
MLTSTAENLTNPLFLILGGETMIVGTKQQQCEKCIDKLMLGLVKKSNEISKGVSLPKKEWMMFYRLQTILNYYPNPQPQQVCNGEAEVINELKEQHGYSIGELAFIFQRSKSTIHAVLKQKKI